MTKSSQAKPLTRWRCDFLLRVGLLDLGHHVVHDRAFTCLPLSTELRKRSTTSTGTCNANRKGLHGFEAFAVGSERGDNKFGHVELEGWVVAILRWMDSKGVNFLSTEVGVSDALGRNITKRNTKASKSSSVETDLFFEPLMRRIYNWLMGGVDGTCLSARGFC